MFVAFSIVPAFTPVTPPKYVGASKTLPFSSVMATAVILLSTLVFVILPRFSPAMPPTYCVPEISALFVSSAPLSCVPPLMTPLASFLPAIPPTFWTPVILPSLTRLDSAVISPLLIPAMPPTLVSPVISAATALERFVIPRLPRSARRCRRRSRRPLLFRCFCRG